MTTDTHTTRWGQAWPTSITNPHCGSQRTTTAHTRTHTRRTTTDARAVTTEDTPPPRSEDPQPPPSEDTRLPSAHTTPRRTSGTTTSTAAATTATTTTPRVAASEQGMANPPRDTTADTPAHDHTVHSAEKKQMGHSGSSGADAAATSNSSSAQPVTNAAGQTPVPDLQRAPGGATPTHDQPRHHDDHCRNYVDFMQDHSGQPTQALTVLPTTTTSTQGPQVWGNPVPRR